MVNKASGEVLENCYVTVFIMFNRKYAITDMESRAVAERLYNYIQLQNRVVHNWMKFMLPPQLAAGSTFIIVATFISIRYTELPLIVYAAYPSTAFNIMVIIFWLCYDTVLLVRASEDIMSQLISHDAEYLKQMPRAMRIQALKRARAMKALEFPVGEFAEFSLDLPVTLWDEILNQVLFLLSF